VETHGVYSLIVILKSANASFTGDIPQFYTAIVGTRCNEASVRGELGRLNPVSVSVDAEHKFAVRKLGDFEGFVL